MDLREEAQSEKLREELIALSRDWERENSCRGYRENGEKDFEGRRVFTVREDGALLAYLFGMRCVEEKGSSVMEKGTPYFEIEELYVVPRRRSQGIGRELFAFAENSLRGEAELLLLSTATKDWKRVLRFYLDELGMDFWSARLFKKISG